MPAEIRSRCAEYSALSNTASRPARGIAGARFMFRILLFALVAKLSARLTDACSCAHCGLFLHDLKAAPPLLRAWRRCQIEVRQAASLLHHLEESEYCLPRSKPLVFKRGYCGCEFEGPLFVRSLDDVLHNRAEIIHCFSHVAHCRLANRGAPFPPDIGRPNDARSPAA